MKYSLIIISFLFTWVEVCGQPTYFEMVSNNPNDTIASDWIDFARQTDSGFLAVRWSYSNQGSRSYIEHIGFDSTRTVIAALQAPHLYISGRQFYWTGQNEILLLAYYYNYTVQRYAIGLFEINMNGSWSDKSISDTTNSMIGLGMCQAMDGGFSITGTVPYADSMNRAQDLLVLKIDKNLEEEWRLVYGDAQRYEWAYSIDQLTDGSYVLSGYTMTGNDFDWLILRVDSAGNLISTDTVDSWGHDVCRGITATADGGYVAAGFIQMDEDPDDYNVRVIKYNANGQRIWDSTYTHPFMKSIGVGRAYELPNDDILLVCSGSQSEYTNDKGVLMRLDKSGRRKWTRSYISGQRDPHFPPFHHYFRDVTLTPDGGFVATGSAFVQSADAWLLKIDSAGCAYPSCDTCAPIIPGYSVHVAGDGLTYTFTDPNASSVKKMWNFGDGRRDTTYGSTITHTYSQSGPYWVCVRKTNYCQELVDTCYRFSVVATGLPEKGSLPHFRLAPNPARSQVQLQWQGTTPEGDLTVYDLQGKAILRKAIRATHTTLATDNWSKGIYLVTIEDRKGALLWRDKLVVE